MKTGKENKSYQYHAFRFAGLGTGREWMKDWLCFVICMLLLLAVIPAMAPAVSHADYAVFGDVYKVLDEGTMYVNSDCFIYIPNNCNDNTACDVHFAGGTGGWILRQDYAISYIRSYSPNSIFIWYKNSGIFDRENRVAETADLLNRLQQETGVYTGTVSITSSSNGGYTALYAASHLKSDYGIQTDKVIILDMGNVWAKSEYLVTEAEAKPMMDMGTVVYHFGRNGETFKMKGAKQFASYGVPLVEVACKGEGHDQITSDAFRFGVFSWVIGEQPTLNDDWYHAQSVNF